MPARSTWKPTLQSDSSVAQKIRVVLELESMGATIEIESVDVANEQQVEKFFKKQADEARPPIQALFHAAGVIEDSAVLDLREETLDRVLRPKVPGTHLLLKHLDKSELQSVVLFSSASALLGSKQSAAYTAANAFLDGLAGSLRQAGVPAFSVNWGSWEKTGMAEREARGERLSSQGVVTMKPEAALEALEFALTHERPQIAVMSVDWPKYFEANVRASATTFLRHLDPRQSKGPALFEAGRLRASSGEGVPPYCDSRGDEAVEARIREILSEVLKTSPDRLDPERRLSTMGLDSIMAVQIRHELELQFGISISVQDIAHSSIADLAQRVRTSSKK